jgi:signal transduction histidine kinase
VFISTRSTLSRQFIFVSLLVMLAGMIIVGIWVGEQIKSSVTNRTGAVTALYVNSYISPRLQQLAEDNDLLDIDPNFFEWLLAETALGQEVVSLKLWQPDGTILYSTDPALVGRRFEIDRGLALALSGQVYSEISSLDEAENVYERQLADELIETYAPVRAAISGEVIAISEFYQMPDELYAEIRAAQIRSWLIVAAVFLIIYLLLATIVDHASHTIVAQQAALHNNVEQLRSLLAQNEDLHRRARRAAARTTAINERYLRRISADLHDGPAQDLALALLRIESLAESGNGEQPYDEHLSEDFYTVRTAVSSALEELRAISAGLRLPAIEPLSPAETVRRAVRDYEQKTQTQVALTLESLPTDAPLAVRITLYRILQEALANGYRHAGGNQQSVHVGIRNGAQGELYIEVTDAGTGFDPDSQSADGSLGLPGMRERVEVLGGRFEINSHPGQGTTIRAIVPLTMLELDDYA